MRVLNVFDIDDTLFKSESKVGIVKQGKRIRELKPGEFNTYKLKPGEQYDFTQFRSGRHFRQTSQPIEKMLNTARRIVQRQNDQSRSIILTARADMKDKSEFLQKFRDHNFPIDDVYVERSGNLVRYNRNVKASGTKFVVLRRYIKTGNYDKIRMWDDSAENLDMLFRVAKLHPNIRIEAYLVDEAGNISRYHSNLYEGWTFSMFDPLRDYQREKLL